MAVDDDRQVGDFAALLRQERRAAGLTQADLAAHARVGVRTVRDAEHGRTGRPHRTTAELLADALGLQHERRARFMATARGQRIPAPRTPLPVPTQGWAATTPLPRPPRLVGRDYEAAALAEAVIDPPAGSDLVTVVGMAGVGKSALALAVAHRVAEKFPGGVAAVTIDEQRDVQETLASIFFGFGAADRQELADYLARRPAVLLLDAVERAPDRVRQVLQRLPAGLRVLATGRSPLRVNGERLWPVVPLEPLPPRTDASLAEVAAYPAAALFLQRLARVRPDPLSDDEVPALVGLVRRLGGLPLALELAAAHGHVMRLPEILQRYGDRVLDLGGGSDQTLREAVAGSYRLLGPADKSALRRLAAFRHRWSIELAEQVLDRVGDPLPLLDRLVDLGLVVVSGMWEERLRLLDVVRDFASEQADHHGELVAVRRAHARAITTVVARTAPELVGPGWRAALARLDGLAADVWAALSHAANDDPHTALELASFLPRWWRLRGRDVAGRGWLSRLLDDPRTAAADPLTRAWAQMWLAALGAGHGDGDAHRPGAEAALALFRRRGEVDGELAAYTALSAVCLTAGRPDEARSFTAEALAVATRHGRTREAAEAAAELARHHVRSGDLAGARRQLVGAGRLVSRSGVSLPAVTDSVLAEVARLEGRYEDAVEIGRRVLARSAELGEPGHRLRVLGTVGQALAASGQVAGARQILVTLRSAAGAAPSAATDAVCALIEARLALRDGDREGAAEWFALAAESLRGSPGDRAVVEALVGVVSCTARPCQRRSAVDELEQVLRKGGPALLPAERRLLGTGPDD
jgi:predicted ATPase/transcriptional regulator with XRE-family HTH domain